MTTITMRNVLAALVSVLALVAPVVSDETQSCSAGAHFDDRAGATAVRAELDAMEHALAQAKSSLRALETLVETQSARLEKMRTLVATPGLTCDGSVAAAERLADAMLAAHASARAERHDRSSAFVDHRLPTYRDVSLQSPRRVDEESSSTIVARRSEYASYAPADARFERPAVARRLDAWTDHLSLTGAVRLERDAAATALATLPQRDPERDDFPRYFAVGDALGQARVLRADGDVAVTLPSALTDSESSESSESSASASGHLARRRGVAVSALAASYQRKNETIIVSGTEDGGVVFYQVFESADDTEDPRTLAGTVFASYASLRSISPEHARGLAVPAKKANWEKERDRLAKVARRRDAASGRVEDGGLENAAVSVATVGVVHPQGAQYDARDDDEDVLARVPASRSHGGSVATSARVTAVAAYRLNGGKRFFAVADASGALVVFADRGATVHSVYRLRDAGEDKSNPNATPDYVVAFKPSRRAISWVTRTGVGSLDVATFVMRRAPCAAAEGDAFVPFARVAFDAAHAAKFYAVTESGETVAGVVGGVDVGTGAGVRATCALRHRNVGPSPGSLRDDRNEDAIRVDASGASLASVKGYAFVALGARVSVLNVTEPRQSGMKFKRPPKEVVVADVTRLASEFGGAGAVAVASGGATADGADRVVDDVVDDDVVSGTTRSALVATDTRGKFVVVALPGGFIATYESALYVFKPEPVNTKLWSQPLFVVAMGAAATFQFYRSKNSAGRRFAGGARADAPARFDRTTHASRGADSTFDPAAFRKQMERDGRWRRTAPE